MGEFFVRGRSSCRGGYRSWRGEVSGSKENVREERTYERMWYGAKERKAEPAKLGACVDACVKVSVWCFQVRYDGCEEEEVRRRKMSRSVVGVSYESGRSGDDCIRWPGSRCALNLQALAPVGLGAPQRSCTSGPGSDDLSLTGEVNFHPFNFNQQVERRSAYRYKARVPLNAIASSSGGAVIMSSQDWAS